MTTYEEVIQVAGQLTMAEKIRLIEYTEYCLASRFGSGSL